MQCTHFGPNVSFVCSADQCDVERGRQGSELSDDETDGASAEKERRRSLAADCSSTESSRRDGACRGVGLNVSLLTTV